MKQTKDSTPAASDPPAKAKPSVAVEPCDKAHDAEQSRSGDEDEACFDSVR